jgi:hypothetical protein
MISYAERESETEARPDRGSAAEPKRSERTATAGGLPPRLRANLEAMSGLAMDDVRVHRNSSEPARLAAVAFTRGKDIHLGPGQERHLPHEAWHAVQQKQGRVGATEQMKQTPVNGSSGLEDEADSMAARITASPVRRPASRAHLRGWPATPVTQLQKAGSGPRSEFFVRPGASAVDQATQTLEFGGQVTATTGILDIILGAKGRISLEHKAVKAVVERGTRPQAKKDKTGIGFDIGLQLQEIAKLLLPNLFRAQLQSLKTPWSPSPMITSDTEKYTIRTTARLVPTEISSVIYPKNPLKFDWGHDIQAVATYHYTLAMKERSAAPGDPLQLKVERETVHVAQKLLVILIFLGMVAALILQALGRLRAPVVAPGIMPVNPGTTTYS